ncbi:MAG: asparagine synthase (glutamine-hydrolyzing) [Myxococcales bacterium]|nr:asparagine synthase (glutamine-hydrolyzing) [Myxococcota bacterium]MDW8281105.1 asparagine synthase (glutamine-hydrolyzing) [Myxococcales bacterium]
MCAIVGLVTVPLPAQEAAQVARRVRRMAAILRHRGPDGDGLWSDGGPGLQVHLGHRRLAIIDPSPAGAQPMADHSGRYVIVFNGAIYNYIELSAELRARAGAPPLRGHSDTEVLVEAWAAWGPACLERLRGMFAFAIWDRLQRTLWLCRDRFGKKPLYYAWLPGGPVRLAFASEQKALFVLPQLAPRPNMVALAEFLRTHAIDHHEEWGTFEAILQVPPAGLLRIAPQEPPRLSRYWTLPPVPARDRISPGPALVARVRELLTDAITVRLRSDVPLGGTLSGGLDSSLLTALVAGPLYRLGLLSGPYRVFLSQFPGTHEETKGDETPWAERMLASLPKEAVLPLRSRPTLAELGADLEDVLYHQEEPFADSSICAHYALMRLVQASGVKVLLTGQGADEIFGGYVSYYYAFIGHLLRQGRLVAAISAATARARLLGESRARLLLAGLYHATPRPLRERLHALRVQDEYPLSAAGRALCASAPGRYECGELPDRRFPPFDAYLLDCVHRWALPHILRQDDRNTMAFGIESRAPYLDHRLAELVFATTPQARMGQGYTKWLLREVARGLMPEEVRLRPDKMGFWSPQRQWLLAHEDRVRAEADPLPPALADLTDGPAWRASLEDFFRRRRHALVGRIWVGFLCSVWLRRTVPRLAALAREG